MPDVYAAIAEVDVATQERLAAILGLLARRPGVAEAVRVDPSPLFIAKAGELAAGSGNLSFEERDGRALRFGDGDFDVVVCHTVLCHVPEPERVLAEAFRVLRPGGVLAVCDGDYATITVALGEGDPLQGCIEAVKEAGAWRRAEADEFYGFIGFASYLGRKPD
jgi:SAM-dependent methyltransferase